MTKSKTEAAVESLFRLLGEQRFHRLVYTLEYRRKDRLLFWQEEALARVKPDLRRALPADLDDLWLALAQKADFKALKARFFSSVKENLVPQLRLQGFKGSGKHYRRIRQGVIHTIFFYGDKWGESAGIALGMHPTFLPVIGVGGPPDPRKVKHMDCEFLASVDNKKRRDRMWRFTDESSPEAGGLSLAKAYLERGEDLFQHFDTVEKVAGMYTPQQLRDGSGNDPVFIGTTRVRNALVMAYVHVHLGRFETALEFARLPVELNRPEVLAPYFAEVLRCCEARSTEPAYVNPMPS